MMITKYLRKLFIGGEWYLAIRTIPEKDDLLSKGDEKYYKVFIPEDKYWCADPFLYKFNGKNYIFFEAFNKWKEKGEIGVAELVNGYLEDYRIIIEQNYHMSYPRVFYWNNTHYMIPETSENQTIELYRAESFPGKWILDTVLKSRITSVDSTFVNLNGDMRLFSYEITKKNYRLNFYRLDMKKKKLIFQYSVPFEENTGRPAGSLLYINGMVIRPSQDCQSKYGHKIMLNKIIEWNETDYKEHYLGDFYETDIVLDNIKNADRIHTINRLDNTEVIDFFQEEFDSLHAFKMLRRKIRKRFLIRHT